MSKSVVWASTVMTSPTARKFFRNALAEDRRNSELDDGCRNEAGEALSAENFPTEIWGVRSFDESKSLPHIFMGYGPWIVSKSIVDVMQQFDMGQGGFFHVRVLKKDRETPMPGEWFCLNFGNVKKVLLGGASTGLQRFGTGTTDRWNAPPTLNDGQLVLATDALAGPDIWVDPRIFDLFFVSDRLAKALKDAGLARAFGFRKCKIVDQPPR